MSEQPTFLAGAFVMTEHGLAQPERCRACGGPVTLQRGLGLSLCKACCGFTGVGHYPALGRGDMGHCQFCGAEMPGAYDRSNEEP
jgi:hypothetical protein